MPKKTKTKQKKVVSKKSGTKKKVVAKRVARKQRDVSSSMSKHYVIANWKMNPATVADAKELFLGVRPFAKKYPSIKTIICPPTVFLDSVRKLYTTSASLALGIQDISSEKSGARTGEVSVSQAQSTGASYTLIGHSEVRARGDSLEAINKKMRLAHASRMTAVLCIGERERDEHGAFYEEIAEQIQTALSSVPQEDLVYTLIAYEPIWAIGKGEQYAMTPADVHEMTIFVKRILHELYKNPYVLTVPILYGGSVGENNIHALMQEGGISGVLVGGVSLNIDTFGAMLATITG